VNCWTICCGNKPTAICIPCCLSINAKHCMSYPCIWRYAISYHSTITAAQKICPSPQLRQTSRKKWWFTQ
jgi:hypothetical protein